MRQFATHLFCCAVVIWIGAGCSPRMNTKAPIDESAFLSGTVQLTHGFERAGEAYFSPDMKWIVFQGVPVGEKNYQMYVARLKWEGRRMAGLEAPCGIT